MNHVMILDVGCLRQQTKESNTAWTGCIKSTFLFKERIA